jgi:hypothetical protein
MSPSRDDCRRARNLVLDHVVEGGGATWPAAALSHFAGCGACRRYAGGLDAARDRRAGGEGRPPLYDPELRRRTLGAVHAARAATGTAARAALLAILVAASAAAVFTGIVLPVWVTTRLLEILITPGWTAVAAAVAACSSLGLLAVGPGALALMRARRPVTSRPDPHFTGWR